MPLSLLCQAPVPECIEPQLGQIEGHISRQKAAARVQLRDEIRDARDIVRSQEGGLVA